MTKPWLTVVGIGEDGLEGLSPIARRAVDGAEVLAGGARHLAMVPGDGRERLAWAAPFMDSVKKVLAFRGRPVTVLGTGDPMWFGIGVTLAALVGPEEMRVIPAPSAFSLAAGRMGWPLAHVECLSVHGRPLERLAAFLAPGARLLVLTAGGEAPRDVARLLVARGYGESRLVALAHMGGESEERLEATAAGWGETVVPDLHTLAIDCVAGPDARLLARVPGLPDEAFASDGQLTKREVRAVTLAALMPMPEHLLWDVGAGSGSVSIEWCRAACGARAVAVEPDADRCALIGENASTLGAPDVEIVHGAAPAALDGLARPEAIFIGGGLAAEGVIEACWEALSPGGRLVANAVSLEGEALLSAAQGRFGGGLIRLAVDRAEALGRFRGWRPMRPVTQWRTIKT